MKAKSKKIMGFFLALVMLLGCLPLNTIETYAAEGDVAIDATNFPDENFRKYVKKEFDKDNSGALSQDELDDVSRIDIREMNISSVKGIEYFSNLLGFEGYKNKLTELDLSHNPALTYVGCGNNQLTTLDLSHNPALTVVDCSNNQLTTLDLSNNTVLEGLTCDNNQLTTLDLSNNTALVYVDCGNNQLTTLDLSNNTALVYVDCGNNQLTTLKLPSSPIADKITNQKYIISVPKGTSIMDFPAGFDVNKIQGTVAGLNITSSGIEWDEQTGIYFKYKLCDNPELIVDVSVETKTVPNPDLEKAKQLVEKAEADKTEENYTKAKAAVDALVKGSGKDGLETRLADVRASLDELKEAKEQAKDEIGNLPNLNEDEKAPFIKKVDDAQTNGDVEKAVEDARNADDLKAYKEKAKEEIGKLPNLSDTEKDEYKGKVDNATDKSGVDQAVNDAKAKDTANKELKEAKEKAKDEIGKLPNLSDDEKKDAKDKVDKATTKEEVKAVVDEAKAKDEENKNAADEKNKPATPDDKEKAKDEIDKLPNLSEDEKTDAKGKVDNAQTKGDVEKAVEDAKAKDAENKNAADEKNKPATDDDKNAAKDKIDQLPNLSDDEKDKYKGDVDNAQTKGEVDKAVNDAKAKDTANKNAADEKNKPATPDDKNAAKDEIDKLPNLSDTEKDKYKGDVDNAQTKGDVKKAVEDAKAKDAENKNAADEKNKPATADDKNKAKDEIDKLPNLSDDEKDKYKKQVDEAQTKGDVAKIVDEAKAKSGVPAPEPSPTPNPSVDRDHDYWYRPYWTYSYGTSNTTKQKPVKTNLVKLESKLVIGSKEMVKSVDGVEQKINMDIAPFIEGNRTMLPIRFVAESLGFNVQWDKESRTVILIDKENVVKIPVDTNQIIVNGKVYESDVKPVIRNNRTMLPIANIARALGLKDGTDIIWNAATKEVKINREIEK